MTACRAANAPNRKISRLSYYLTRLIYGWIRGLLGSILTFIYTDFIHPKRGHGGVGSLLILTHVSGAASNTPAPHFRRTLNPYPGSLLQKRVFGNPIQDS